MRFTVSSVCVLLFVGLAIASEGKRCLRHCTKEYRPVCGKNQAGDHREFNNECERLNYNCVHPDSKYELEEEGRCPQRLCIRLCTKDYHPVCGSNAQGELRTFSNECERKNYNCRNPEGEYEYVRDGSCTQRLCTRLCTKEYRPVCGRNPEGQLRRFNNACLMANYNCSHPAAEYEVVPNETCPPNLCTRLCTKEYRPVCGRNPEGQLRRFNNACLMANYNCSHPGAEYDVVPNETCPPNLCTRLCTKEYVPVCGRNPEGQLRRFNNACLMANYNCSHPGAEYDVVPNETCPPNLCTRLCTKEYVPVCGRNPEGQLRSFNNACLMANYNCSHPGAEYEVVPNENCPPRLCTRLCTHEHNPVCARNPEGHHRTFRSECDMKNYNCEHPESEYVVVQNGTCPTRLCTRLCPHESHPVCGKNQEGDHHTFSSECELENYNCGHPDSEYEHEYDGNCTQCPVFCPLLYKPVCGKNSEGEYETFSNECLLKAANCRRPKSPYEVVSHTTCEDRPVSSETSPTDDCLTACPLIYSPICASNAQGSLRTFDNECDLKGHNCRNPDSVYERVSQGECRREYEPDCPERCPKLFKPVCGKTKEGHLKTFPNECELKKYNCNNTDSKYELQSVGSCNQQKRSADCQHACPSVFFPVCVRTPQGDLLTFANECELDIYKCRNPNSGYERVGQGSCDKYGEEGEHPETHCPKWCTREYLPVCGKNSEGDHRTFPNSCEWRRYNCENTDSHYEHEHNGSCTQEKRSEHHEVCSEQCNKMLRPVCGTTAQGERRTFDNECLLNSYNCLNPNSRYEFLHNGSCGALSLESMSN